MYIHINQKLLIMKKIVLLFVVLTLVLSSCYTKGTYRMNHCMSERFVGYK